MFLRTFEFSFFRKNDIRTFELVSQLRNSYDYIVIDDIDYINDDFIQILFKSKKTIICTCLQNRVYSDINYPHQNFYIKNGYIELPTGDEVTMDNLIKSLKREDKINLLLNDKG
jgi:hypothetical protein